MNLQMESIKYKRALRKDFINKFADKTLPQYRYVMQHGDFYGANTHKGCLWEVIRPYNVISFEKALETLKEYEELFVIWDDRRFCFDGNNPKTPVLKFNGIELSKLLAEDSSVKPNEKRSLPIDIYVFDRELSFHITFTHITIEGFGRVCITSKEKTDDFGISPAFEEFIKETELGK